MLESIVAFSVRWRIAVLVVSAAVLAGSLRLARSLPIDAVPDVTNVQVQVLTDSPGLSAEEVERYITFPIEMGLSGLPDLAEIRSVTRAGLSAVTVIFREHVDVWFARQLVLERLRGIEQDIPSQFGRPELAPVSSGLGEIYQFVLRSDRHTPMQLRTMLQWQVSPMLRAVPGVIEVNALGGGVQEYHVVIDAHRLAAHRITLPQVVRALEQNNANVGGGYIERGPEQFVIRGEGQLRTVEDIASVVVSTDADGTPVLIRHLGRVEIGARLPQGVVTQDGRGEVVSGIVMMLIGQNSRDVVRRVHRRMDEVRRVLPEGVRVDVVYDRASFINRTLRTVGTNLVEGALLVGLVLLVLLGTIRGSLIVTIGIPFAMGVAILGMLQLRVTGNLMSLGAIDFGLLVDGPIVLLEAVMARLTIDAVNDKNRVEHVEAALKRVVRPVVFSVAIILLVYLPLLALEGVEGKMFRPMAVTMALALGGSLLFALVVFPAAAATFMRVPKKGHGGGWIGWLEKKYAFAIRSVMRRRAVFMVGAIAAVVAAVPVAMRLGADFVPRIDEGDIVVAVRRLPSVGIAEARRLDLAVENVLRRFPEVVTSLGMAGRAELAVDPVGIDSTDILVRLRPVSEWRTAHDIDALGEAIKRAIESEVPSTFVSISQPIEDRTNELISGSRADVAIHLFGEDLHTMSDLARNIGRVVRGVAGAGDVRVERILGLPELRVRADRARLARYGIPVDDVLAAVQASRIGRPVGVIFEENRRFDLRVILPPTSERSEGFRTLPIGTHSGELVPLGLVADVRETEGPAQISREGMRRRARIEVNIRGRDLIGFVQDAQARVAREVRLPSGYSLEWGGQFENFRRASERLGVVVPIALGIIFSMLFFAFGSLRYALTVFSAVPFALIGGIVALKLRGMTFSLPAAVGFIALCGIAVLNGVVMASEVKRLIDGGTSRDEAIVAGATSVLRALILTAAVAALGFAPMAVSSSAGSEVQRPLATVVIGGLVSSSLLGAFLLPVLLRVFLRDDDGVEGDTGGDNRGGRGEGGSNGGGKVGSDGSGNADTEGQGGSDGRSAVGTSTISEPRHRPA